MKLLYTLTEFHREALKLKPGADALESAMELVEDLKLSAKE